MPALDFTCINLSNFLTTLSGGYYDSFSQLSRPRHRLTFLEMVGSDRAGHWYLCSLAAVPTPFTMLLNYKFQIAVCKVCSANFLASESPVSLLKIQIAEFHSRPTESGMGPRNLNWSEDFALFWHRLKLRSHHTKQDFPRVRNCWILGLAYFLPLSGPPMSPFWKLSPCTLQIQSWRSLI